VAVNKREHFWPMWCSYAGDLPGAGTDADVVVEITGERGNYGPHQLYAKKARECRGGLGSWFRKCVLAALQAMLMVHCCLFAVLLRRKGCSILWSSGVCTRCFKVCTDCSAYAAMVEGYSTRIMPVCVMASSKRDSDAMQSSSLCRKIGPVCAGPLLITKPVSQSLP